MVRIPADNLDGVLADAKKLGTVESMLSVIHGVVVTVGFLIPWIPVLAVLALIGVLIWRRKPFRRAAPKNVVSQSSPDALS